ncbi:MAG: malto-oligosyltrehalose trehalohydrolase [Acidiferrobacterales bacterium]
MNRTGASQSGGPVYRRHCMPFGAEVLPAGGVRFRLWAPAAHEVTLCIQDGGAARTLPMKILQDGWFELTTGIARPGTRYRYRIDGGVEVPDPASRHQPQDVHGPSEVIDPLAFGWSDGGWRGRPWSEAVLYELHVGAFSREGNFAGVQSRLDRLADLGVTAIELMPLSDFPGTRNWGYDGVLPFAPDSSYGDPPALKALVQAAHARGLMVFLDVVYNHFGPDGNYLPGYAPAFLDTRFSTPWGAAINFGGAESTVVRQYFIHNALYWIEEFHLDGLRLDAVHAIRDASQPDFLEELAQAVAQGPGESRRVHLVLENDRNEARYLTRDADCGQSGYVAQWNDDIHHALHVLVTGERSGYYGDYADVPVRHLGRCLTEGFSYQGEASCYRGGTLRGEATSGLPLTAFVSALQTHDQVGNRAFGERIGKLATEAAVRAATAVLLLAPSPPLLFMGQEWGAVEPFPFFCDFGTDLAEAVKHGRRAEFAHLPAFRDPQALALIPDPNDVRTFESAKLNWHAPGSGSGRRWWQWHRKLLAIRQREIVPHIGHLHVGGGQFRLYGEAALGVRWKLDNGHVLALLANLGSGPVPAGDWTGGRVILSIGGMEAGAHSLPPWSVLWLVDVTGAEMEG